jgi:uncharacterized protein YciI
MSASDLQNGAPWEVVVSTGRKQGLHAEQLFLVVSKPVAGFGPVFAALDEHVPFQKKLEAEGVMFAAGPVANGDGIWEGEGIFVYKAASVDEAMRIAEQDPMHASGARTFEVRPWLLNEGTSTFHRKGEAR